MLERKGAVVAYVTTRGFKDVPFIQRGNRKSHYDMSWVKPKPLVKRRHCFELDERIDAYGQVVTPLDEAEVRAVAARIRDVPEIRAVAVCLLFSYLNPSHEQRVLAILTEELPDLPISISYAVLPKWKEYERASTTIADAYLKPVVSRQLQAMRGRLDDAQLNAHTVVIKSNGGEMTLAAAAEAPVNMVVSGPDWRRHRQPLRRRPRRASSTSSRSTWAAPRPTSRPSRTAARASPPPSRSSGACRSRSR